MKTSVIAAGIIGSLLISGWNYVAAGAESRPQKQVVCPVMGGAVNTNLFVDHDGKRIYVCCAGCIAAVRKEPAKYIAKLEKDGVVLDRTPAADMERTPAAEAAPAKTAARPATSGCGGCK